MNTKLIDSLTQIIEALTPEEQSLLQERIKVIQDSQQENINPKVKKHTFSATATYQEWIEEFREWVASHQGRNFPYLSDEAISRDSIYEERG